MDDYFTNWLLLVGLFSVAVMAPGPDFVMAIRNSVVYSRRTGLYTALGFGAGVAIHVLYTAFGLAAIIAQSVIIFSIIKYCGAAYLIWMGFKALRSKGFDMQKGASGEKAEKDLTRRAAFLSGFWTNVLNPKASLFFLALFSQFFGADTPLWVMGIYGLTTVIMVTGWFSIVTLFLTNWHIRAVFLKATKWIDRIAGVLFILMGLRLATISKIS